MYWRLSRILLSALDFHQGSQKSQPSYQRLADAAKLWVYVKYFHPSVTAAPVDWDRAFTGGGAQTASG